MKMSRRSELISGLKSMIPISLGSIPYGLLYGALVSGLDTPMYFKVGISPIVFAGSAQLVAIGLLMTDAPLPVIVLSVLIVNLRHLFYGASLIPYMNRLSTWWRMLLAFLTVDEVYVLAITNYKERDWSSDQNQYFQWYYFGAGILSWVEWTITSIAGIFLAAGLPQSIPLDFMLPLSFIALIIPSLKSIPSVLSGLFSGVLMIALLGLPYKLGLVITVIIGVIIGLILEQSEKV